MISYLRQSIVCGSPSPLFNYLIQKCNLPIFVFAAIIAAINTYDMPLNAERRKILCKLIPEGAIVTRQWLLGNRFDRHAIDNLVKSHQLKTLSYGVYSRGEASGSWEAVVYALQAFDKLDCVVSGLTSLELQGLAHYLPLSKKKHVIRLSCPEPLPKWVTNFSPDITFIRHNTKNIFNDLRVRNSESFTMKRAWKENMPGLVISVPERAMLEALLDVPDEITFEHAKELMEGMTTFSPLVVQSMLEQSTNVKCKRLFLWLAERQNHAWFSRINPNKIDLGSGNRMLVKGGKLDKKYWITVPKEIVIDGDLF